MTSKPNTSKPNTSKPNTSKPNTPAKPNTSKPNTSKPNTPAKPNTSKPNTPAKPKIDLTAYNSAVRTARAAVKRAGIANWVIGDAALTVGTKYSENKLGQFADDIGVELPSVRNMRTVSAAYQADAIARDLQSWTVYGVFASQDDRYALIAAGNDGKPWSVSAARALVKGRNESAESPAEMPGGSESDESPAEVSDLEKARAEVQRLEGELLKARAKLAKLEAGIKQQLPMLAADGTDSLAATVPAPIQHSERSVPAHVAGDFHAACKQCQAAKASATVTEISTPRRARSRKTAA
jgi:hypothetical protein